MSAASTHPLAATVAIVVNGEPVSCDASCSIAALLARRGLVGKRVAIERNGAIVPRSRHAETHVEDGDRIEIVVAVGGG
jgi:sulfur carrier protein